MEKVYDVTCAKTTLLYSMGFTEVEMWECFWDNLSKHNPWLIQFFSHLGNCRTPTSAPCILRWKDRRYMFVPEDQWSPRRKSSLNRCHFWISVGEQIQNLCRGTSTDFNKSSDHWSIRLLWHRQSGYCTTNKHVVESVTAPHELFEYLYNSLVVIHAIRIFSEDVFEVVFSYVDEDASKGK